MKTVIFKSLSIKLSIFLFVLVSCSRYYIDNFLFNNASIALLFIAIILLVLNMISERKIVLTNKKYFIVSMLLFLPSLYKNAYISDHNYALFVYYFLVVIYSICICFSNITKDEIKCFFKFYLIFSLMTGIVTWFSLFFPNMYVQKFIPLMPSNIRRELTINFLKLNNRMGLTSHYSRNAFFLILGILSSIFFTLENKNNKFSKISLVFLLITMLIVGKRGHFLFLVLSLIISYFIIYRVSIKTFMKFIFIVIIAIVFLGITIKVIPEANNTFERFVNSNNDSVDISSGRFEMYEDIFKMYKENDYVGIGWSKYASNTNYVHPGVHNDYIQLLCETGVLGFIIVIGTNFYILRKAILYVRKNRNSISVVIIVYNVFFLLYSLTGLPHYDVETYMYYFFINSILFYISNFNLEFKLLK